MFRILDRNVKMWQMLVLVSVMGLLVGGGITIAAPQRGSPPLPFPAGSIQLSSAARSPKVHIPLEEGPEDGGPPPKIVLRTAISVPSGKVAEVQATYSVDIHPVQGSDYVGCQAWFTLDSLVVDNEFHPGEVALLEAVLPQNNNVTRLLNVGASMSGSRRSIGPGHHYVNVRVLGPCDLYDQALNVGVNIH